MKKGILDILGLAAFPAVLCANIARAADALQWNAGGPAPKLILQFTVFQLRGDLPGRFLKNTGDGGCAISCSKASGMPTRITHLQFMSCLRRSLSCALPIGFLCPMTHGSPWRYDTKVPVVFAGGDLNARRVYREIQTVDLAPTPISPAVALGNPVEKIIGTPTLIFQWNRLSPWVVPPFSGPSNCLRHVKF